MPTVFFLSLFAALSSVKLKINRFDWLWYLMLTIWLPAIGHRCVASTHKTGHHTTNICQPLLLFVSGGKHVFLSLWYMNCERRLPTSGAHSAPAPVNLFDLNDIMIKINDIVFHVTKNTLRLCTPFLFLLLSPLSVHVHRFSSFCVVVKWIWRENRVVHMSYGLCRADHLYILLIDWWRIYFVVCTCHTMPFPYVPKKWNYNTHNLFDYKIHQKPEFSSYHFFFVLEAV